MWVSYLAVLWRVSDEIQTDGLASTYLEPGLQNINFQEIFQIVDIKFMGPHVKTTLGSFTGLSA